MPSSLTVTVPSAGVVVSVTLRVSPSGSESLASTAMSTGRFRPVEASSSTATGAPLATATVTVVVSLVASPSVDR